MKEIPSCPGYYITEDAEVYSAHRQYAVKGVQHFVTTFDVNNLKKLTYSPKPSGYCYIELTYGMKRISRLVAETYLPNPNNLPEVDHLDRNKSNNNVTNLEWVDHYTNMERALAKHYIVEHIASGEHIEVFNLAKWCRERGLNHSVMCRTANPKAKNKTHRGYRLL